MRESAPRSDRQVLTYAYVTTELIHTSYIRRDKVIRSGCFAFHENLMTNHFPKHVSVCRMCTYMHNTRSIDTSHATRIVYTEQVQLFSKSPPPLLPPPPSPPYFLRPSSLRRRALRHFVITKIRPRCALLYTAREKLVSLGFSRGKGADFSVVDASPSLRLARKSSLPTDNLKYTWNYTDLIHKHRNATN